jgi:hypothetical protein
LRAHLAAAHVTQGEYAESLGWRRGRLSRVLVGQVWVPLLDLEEILDSFDESIATISFDVLPHDQRWGARKLIVAGWLRSQLHALDHDREDESTRLLYRWWNEYRQHQE